MKILSHHSAKKKTEIVKSFEFCSYRSFSSDIMAVKGLRTPLKACAINTAIGNSGTLETASTTRVNTSHFHELFDPDTQDRPYQHLDAGCPPRYLAHILCRTVCCGVGGMTWWVGGGEKVAGG